MTVEKDSQEKENSDVRAEFLDTGVEQRLTDAAKLAGLLELVTAGKKNIALSEAHNATRLHTHNVSQRRALCDEIDEHRTTDEGRAVYNAKRREQYVPVGDEKREYVTGLSDEEKKERRRLQKRASDKKARANTPTPLKSAKRAATRKRKAQREAEAAERELATRRIF